MYTSSSSEVILLSNKPNSFIAKALGKNIRTIQRKRKDNLIDIYIAECLNNKTCDIATSKTTFVKLNTTSDNATRQLDDNIATSKRQVSDTEHDKLCDKIATLEAEILQLKNLVITSTKAVLEVVGASKNGDIFKPQSDTEHDKLCDIVATKGGLGVLEDSNTNINLVDIKDSKKESKKKKATRQPRATTTFKDEYDKQAYEYFRDSYPKTAYKSKEEICQRHWHKLTDKQKQEALDKVELIKKIMASRPAGRIDKLQNVLWERRWEQFDEESLTLSNSQNGFYSKQKVDVGEEIMRRMQRAYGG